MIPAEQTPQASGARLLGLCGSLRAGSLNARLLRYVTGLLNDQALHLEIFDSLAGLPLYNADLDTGQSRHHDEAQDGADRPGLTPPGVSRLRQAIRSAEGLIIATPEYNHTIPGVLKNALDWASRPTTDLPLTGKAIAVFVATRGRLLGHRGLSDTIRLLTGFANIVVPGPEVVVTSAHEKLATGTDGTIELRDPYLATPSKGSSPSSATSSPPAPRVSSATPCDGTSPPAGGDQ